MQNKGQSYPLRTCVGCRLVREKAQLLRVVRTPEGRVCLDPSGKARGRGAYLCRDKACWEAALKRGALARSLHISWSEEQKEEILKELDAFEQGNA